MRYSWKKADVKNTMSMAVIFELPSCENHLKGGNVKDLLKQSQRFKLCHDNDTGKIFVKKEDSDILVLATFTLSRGL